MMPFDEFRSYFLDFRIRDGDRGSISRAFWMAHGYEMACEDYRQRQKAMKFKDNIRELVLIEEGLS